MTSTELAPLLAREDCDRIACWDPIAECSMVMASPAAEPEMFAEYHRGAIASYARFGVEDALDSDVEKCADDTALFWAIMDLDGRMVGGVRAKGPLLCPEDSHAVVEWAGQAGEREVHEMIAERVPLGIIEMKSAWLAKEPGGTRHRAKMIARSGFHAMAFLGINFCMATTAAHILEQWSSSGGVVAAIPATPYPDERYETKMMWWDRRTFTEHGDSEQVSAIFRDMAQVRRVVEARRTPAPVQAVSGLQRATRRTARRDHAPAPLAQIA